MIDAIAELRKYTEREPQKTIARLKAENDWLKKVNKMLVDACDLALSFIPNQIGAQKVRDKINDALAKAKGGDGE